MSNGPRELVSTTIRRIRELIDRGELNDYAVGELRAVVQLLHQVAEGIDGLVNDVTELQEELDAMDDFDDDDDDDDRGTW